MSAIDIIDTRLYNEDVNTTILQKKIVLQKASRTTKDPTESKRDKKLENKKNK